MVDLTLPVIIVNAVALVALGFTALARPSRGFFDLTPLKSLKVDDDNKGPDQKVKKPAELDQAPVLGGFFNEFFKGANPIKNPTKTWDSLAGDTSTAQNQRVFDSLPSSLPTGPSGQTKTTLPLPTALPTALPQTLPTTLPPSSQPLPTALPTPAPPPPGINAQPEQQQQQPPAPFPRPAAPTYDVAGPSAAQQQQQPVDLEPAPPPAPVPPAPEPIEGHLPPVYRPPWKP